MLHGPCLCAIAVIVVMKAEACSLFPRIDAVADVDVFRGELRVFAAGALGLVVDERTAGVGGEAGDGVEVRQAQETHEEVGEVPDELERREAAEENHEHDANAED